MIYICITADYEVFLKKNYVSVNELLLKPALYASQKCNEANIPITFFVDTLYLKFLDMNKENDMSNQIKENIQFLYKKGNAIELHIHPHWMYTKKEGQDYSFDPKMYRLAGVAELKGEDESLKLIDTAVDYLLNDIMKNEFTYNCKAFRAGGWSLQPEQLVLPKLFQKGVAIDSSVVKGSVALKNRMEHYDYSKCPSSTYWLFNAKEKVCSPINNNKNAMLELPVYTSSGWKAIYHKIIKILSRKVLGSVDYTCKGESCLEKKSNKDKLYQLFAEPIRFSLDNYDDIEFYFSEIKHLQRKGDDSFVCFYFHPKLIRENAIDKFVQLVKTLDKSKVRFITLNEMNTIVLKNTGDQL